MIGELRRRQKRQVSIALLHFSFVNFLHLNQWLVWFAPGKEIPRLSRIYSEAKFIFRYSTARNMRVGNREKGPSHTFRSRLGDVSKLPDENRRQADNFESFGIRLGSSSIIGQLAAFQPIGGHFLDHVTRKYSASVLWHNLLSSLFTQEPSSSSDGVRSKENSGQGFVWSTRSTNPKYSSFDRGSHSPLIA